MIALPNAELGGVTTWAARTLEAVGDHRARIVSEPDPGLDLAGAAAVYRGAAESLIASGIDRVLLAPQQSGSCYAAACCAAHELATSETASIGVLGWMHSVIRYDVELIRRFAPGLSAVVCVSEASRGALEGAIEPERLVVAHTGVGLDTSPMDEPRRAGPLRLIYTGRLEQNQKRALALPACVRTLRGLGIDCELVVIGDGPDREAFEHAARAQAGIATLGALSADSIHAHLADSDLYLLPSRSEGLGLGRIEAALARCAPMVCEGSGGAIEGIEHGVSGLIVPAAPEMDEQQVGDRMAACIAEAYRRVGLPGITEMGKRARVSAVSLCDPRTYRERLLELMRRSVTTETHREFWASVARGPGAAADFTVPTNAADRLSRYLEHTGLESVLLYGGGAHTSAIWDVFEKRGVEVVGVIDDNPARAGSVYRGAPVSSPSGASALGVSDVLISSWLHEGEMWNRRGVLEAQGLRVHRLYDADVSAPGTANAQA